MDNKVFSFKIFLENIWEWCIKEKFYYSILWAVLKIFEDDDNIYKNILSISWLIQSTTWEYFTVISILWSNNFNHAINSLIEQKKEVSINKHIFKIKKVDFIFSVFDFETKANINWIKYLELVFLSPTYIKKTLNEIDINYLLPTPDTILLSAVRKFYYFKKEEFDEDEYRKYIKSNFFVSKFFLKTKQITIKNNKKAWVVWNIKYNFLEKAKKDKRYEILIRALYLANHIWIWTWTRLGLWQTKIIFGK